MVYHILYKAPNIIKISAIFWPVLGFYRGVKSYNFNYKNNKSNDKNYMYIYSICNGFCGMIFYANVFLLPFTIHKEFYRLEVNIRDLENEKKSNYYYDLL
jgi:hypothetical protein